MARIQADVNDQIKTDAKIAALRKGVTLSQLVEAAIREYLERHKF
jgi:predicted HicB family RNase H-like nuclease